MVYLDVETELSVWPRSGLPASTTLLDSSSWRLSLRAMMVLEYVCRIDAVLVFDFLFSGYQRLQRSSPRAGPKAVLQYSAQEQVGGFRVQTR